MCQYKNQSKLYFANCLRFVAHLCLDVQVIVSDLCNNLKKLIDVETYSVKSQEFKTLTSYLTMVVKRCDNLTRKTLQFLYIENFCNSLIVVNTIQNAQLYKRKVYWSVKMYLCYGAYVPVDCPICAINTCTISAAVFQRIYSFYILYKPAMIL